MLPCALEKQGLLYIGRLCSPTTASSRYLCWYRCWYRKLDLRQKIIEFSKLFSYQRSSPGHQQIIVIFQAFSRYFIEYALTKTADIRDQFDEENLSSNARQWHEAEATIDDALCPLITQKQTFVHEPDKSALCQKQHEALRHHCERDRPAYSWPSTPFGADHSGSPALRNASSHRVSSSG